MAPMSNFTIHNVLRSDDEAYEDDTKKLVDVECTRIEWSRGRHNEETAGEVTGEWRRWIGSKLTSVCSFLMRGDTPPIQYHKLLLLYNDLSADQGSMVSDPPCSSSSEAQLSISKKT